MAGRSVGCRTDRVDIYRQESHSSTIWQMWFGRHGPGKKKAEGEVKLYDRYLAGECYGFVLYQYGEMEDSCWGFLGTFDEVKEDIACELPPECQDLLEHLVEVPDMQQMECEDYEELLEEMEV